MPDFDIDRLDAFLRARIEGLEGPLRLARIAGGQSNPTYFADYETRSLVIRKQPSGELLPSAHAVDREYRVMDALAATDVPVPRMILFHPGREVVGTPFYVMERLEGRVFSDHALPGLAADERHAIYLAMAETMAKLHRVDPAAVGLADFGKPGNYFARQVARWTRQWHASRRRDDRAIDRLIEWLPQHLPPSEETAICHGDLRLGNLMFDPVKPQVIAVLDWELATLGHPLADVAFNAMAWRCLPSEFGGLRGLDLAGLGIPDRDAYLEHYYAHAKHRGRAEPFHFAFALFRFAVIFEGIAARAAAGNAAGDNASETGKLASAFARRALEALEEGPLSTPASPDHA